MADPAAVTILTGFLGSGKTTLLQKLLRSAGGARTAVLINEFGEVGIDHLIVRSVSPTSVVLQNGCICCTIRSDLQAGLRDLVDTARASGGRDFDRVIVETTGLADPVPVVQTLVADPMLRHQMRLAGLVSTVDGLRGFAQLDAQPEAVRQAATADRLVLTKTDLADAEAVDRLRERLAALNPTARVIDPVAQESLWDLLLGPPAPAGSVADTASARYRAGREHDAAWPVPGDGTSRHKDTIRTFVYRTDALVDWTAFAVWLSALVHRHGRQVLRVKGLLAKPGVDTPVLINAIQSFVHPPVHLESWPDSDRSSRLVFIMQDLEPETVRTSLEAFLDPRTPARTSHPAGSLGAFAGSRGRLA